MGSSLPRILPTVATTGAEVHVYSASTKLIPPPLRRLLSGRKFIAHPLTNFGWRRKQSRDTAVSGRPVVHAAGGARGGGGGVVRRDRQRNGTIAGPLPRASSDIRCTSLAGCPACLPVAGTRKVPARQKVALASESPSRRCCLKAAPQVPPPSLAGCLPAVCCARALRSVPLLLQRSRGPAAAAGCRAVWRLSSGPHGPGGGPRGWPVTQTDCDGRTAGP